MIHTRRYDLDWLRVLAFGLLIFYHTGMFYNSEGWHAKSVHMNAGVDPYMWLSSPWRLSLLFLISGIALRFAVDKAPSLWRFAGKRFSRLFVPILFGMVVIVVPQAYFELLGKGEVPAGYLDFYGRYLSAEEGFSIAVPTWNHLWYVVYLLVYSLAVLPFMGVLAKVTSKCDAAWFEKLMHGGRLFIIPAFLFICFRFTTDIWFPYETHALVGDWGAHTRYFSYFLIGILIAKNQTFWQVLSETWKIAAVGALLLAVSLSLLWQNWDTWLGGIAVLENIVRAMRPLYAWVIISAFLGAAQAYLNKPSARLSYLSEAIFPYYILHQSLIIVIGVYASTLGLSVWPEFLMVVTGTVAGCFLIHEIAIRRITILRPLFGVPSKRKGNTAVPRPLAAE